MNSTDVFFAPDIDGSWEKNPGCLTAINGFAPLQIGAYGSVGGADYISGTFTSTLDVVNAYMFRQTAGTVRFLVCAKTNIDEYSAAGARTNRGTGYNSSTTGWSMAAWGNQIIACNYLDATQSSTGAGFTALGGSSPKARFVAANANFVMLADTDDGVNQYPDEVWNSAIQTPTSWAPSIATQAARIRLLDAPGPIRALTAYKDTFVVFKDNAVFVGEYIGPPYVFSWRLVSSRVGCSSMNGVVELDGRLYFHHSSGFYEFDGQSITPIGMPVNLSFLTEATYISYAGGSVYALPVGTSFADGITNVGTVADDVDGVVWWKTAALRSSGAEWWVTLYGFNARTRKWGRFQPYRAGSSSFTSPVMVKASTNDWQTFTADQSGRFVMVWCGNSGLMQAPQIYRYPYANGGLGSGVVAQLTTGAFGDTRTNIVRRCYWKALPGTTNGLTSLTASGYGNSALTVGVSGDSGGVNTELQAADYRINAKYHTITLAWPAANKTIISGLTFTDDGR